MKTVQCTKYGAQENENTEHKGKGNKEKKHAKYKSVTCNSITLYYVYYFIYTIHNI